MLDLSLLVLLTCLLLLLFVLSACKGKKELELGVQVENLKRIARWPELQNCVVLLRDIGRYDNQDRRMLILQPVGCLIPYKIEMDALLDLMKQFAGIVGQLAARGFLHGDLSYYNLLKRQDTNHALLVDMQTLTTLAQVLSTHCVCLCCSRLSCVSYSLMLVCRLLKLALSQVRLFSWGGTSFAKRVTLSVLSWNPCFMS